MRSCTVGAAISRVVPLFARGARASSLQGGAPAGVAYGSKGLKRIGQRWSHGGAPGGPAPAARHDESLRPVDPAHRDDVARVLEQAERAVKAWDVIYTDFLAPPVVAAALAVLSRIADTAAVACGGYPSAERCRCARRWMGICRGQQEMAIWFPGGWLCRIAVGREEALAAARDDPSHLVDGVAAVECRGRGFMFDPATHRDFLGACLGESVCRGCHLRLQQLGACSQWEWPAGLPRRVTCQVSCGQTMQERA